MSKGWYVLAGLLCGVPLGIVAVWMYVAWLFRRWPS